jgi:hypothetical protein
MKPTLALLLAALVLAGCAEINKPITPNDTWREKATRSTNGLPY